MSPTTQQYQPQLPGLNDAQRAEVRQMILLAMDQALRGAVPPYPAKETLGVRDLGKILGVDDQTVIRWGKSGKIPPPMPRTGRKWRWWKADIDAWELGLRSEQARRNGAT